MTSKIKVRVYKRADGRPNPWCVNYQLPDGRRVRRAVSHRKDLATIIARQIEDELNQGNYTSDFTTAAEFLDDVLSEIEASRSRRTFQGYRQTKEAFCKLVGHLRLPDITPGHVQTFLLSLGSKAPATRARQLRELSAMLNTAVKRGYLPRNPCKAVRAPRTPRNPPRTLDKAEVRRLLDTVKETPFHGVITVALYAGPRREEIVWLEWKDVDLESRQLYVRNKPGHTLKDYEARTVPMPDELVEILRRLERNSEWVFTSPTGTRWSADCLSERLRPVFRQANVSGGLHRLRHTYASHLVMNGVDLPSVQKLLGHSSITTTMIYAHVGQAHLKEQVKKLKF